MLTKFDKFLKIYKYIYFAIYLILTIFFAYTLIDEINAKLDPSQSLAGIGFVFVVIIIGGIAYGAFALINLVIMIISISNKSSFYHKKNNILTLIMFILPIITEIILVSIGLIYF